MEILAILPRCVMPQHGLFGLRLLIYNNQDIKYIVKVLKISVEALVLNLDLSNCGQWSLGNPEVQETYVGDLFI